MNGFPDRVVRELLPFVASVDVQGPEAITVSGREVPIRENHRASRGAWSTERGAAREALAVEVYRRAYATAWPGPDETTRDGVDPEFAAALDRSNHATDGWSDGWVAVGVSGDGSVVVELDGRRRRLGPGEFVGRRGPGAGVVIGDAVRIHCPRSAAVEGVHVFAFGEAPLAGAALADEVRYYWNVASESAADLVGELTEQLNGLRVPFRLKAHGDPGAYHRRDAVVLYLERAYAGVAARALPVVHGRAPMPEGVPLFAQPLAPGVGVAESPPCGSSFGVHRSRLVADALLSEAGSGTREPEARLALVAERFEEVGIDPSRPHLNPGSKAQYEWCPPATPWADRPPAPEGSPDHGARAAQAIGAQLAREAIWDGPRCSWVGPAPVGDPPVIGFAALPPGLYDGTAGVALFLTALADATGDPVFASTARGALRQAASAAWRVPTVHQTSFYLGPLGVSAVHLAAGPLLGCAETTEVGETLLHKAVQAASPAEPDYAADMYEGDAGAAYALAQGALRGRDLSGAAAAVADRLLRSARSGPRGVSWPTVVHDGRDDLCGLAHGAVGVAAALAQTYALTGSTRYEHAVQEAVRYERTWEGRDEGTWEDLRTGAGAPVVAWCHGSAGAALARAAVLEGLGSDHLEGDALRAEIAAALRAVGRALEDDMARPDRDRSLCHGVLGRVSVVEEVARRGVEVPTSVAALARTVAAAAVEQYGEEEPWPCGTAGGLTAPTLLTGLAGIGLFYLRQRVPGRYPSPLLPFLSASPDSGSDDASEGIGL